MKKIYLLIIAIVYSSFIRCHEDLPQEPHIFYKIINDNSQKVVQKNTDACDHYFSLPIDEQRLAFKNFSPAERRKHLRQFDFKDFEKFLKAYSEHEWQELRNALTEHERSHWPATVKEQLIALYKIRCLSENQGDALSFAAGAAGSLIVPIITYMYSNYVLVVPIKNDTYSTKELIKEEVIKIYLEKKYEL